MIRTFILTKLQFAFFCCFNDFCDPVLPNGFRACKKFVNRFFRGYILNLEKLKTKLFIINWTKHQKMYIYHTPHYFPSWGPRRKFDTPRPKWIHERGVMSSKLHGLETWMNAGILGQSQTSVCYSMNIGSISSGTVWTYQFLVWHLNLSYCWSFSWL